MIFILEVVAGVLAFVYRAEIEIELCAELVRGIRTKYPSANEPDENGLKAAWDAVQVTVLYIVVLIDLVKGCSTKGLLFVLMNLLNYSFNIC